jgi:hypothetical protein
MTTYLRNSVGALAVVLLAACGGSALEQSTFEHKGGYCVQTRCEGNTPGFWSNENGCEALWTDEDLRTALVARAVELGYPIELNETCSALDGLLKVDAQPMEQKLAAMFVAFSLNFWSDLDTGCELETRFQWSPRTWLPAGAPGACKDAVEDWFDGSNLVEFADLEAKTLEVLAGESACEMETLKSFFDAANNDAKVCVCECVTGATGGYGGGL